MKIIKINVSEGFFSYFSSYSESGMYSYQIFNLKSCGISITFIKIQSLSHFFLV